MPHTIPYTTFPIEKIRADFPILKTSIHQKKLVYLDNGATTQKPQSVIDAIVHYYTHENSNIHRGVHSLSQRATVHYEQARESVQKYIGAASPNEIIFTRGTTESINLVAYCFRKLGIQKGDNIIISGMEHHSNILPWQVLCEETGARLQVIPLDEKGNLQLNRFAELLSSHTKLIALCHVSNSLGIINSIEDLILQAKKQQIPVLIDGAQAVPHMPVNVTNLDCDFYCFSGHKMYAPTGIGVLYAKEKWLELFGPYQTGGGTIKTVSFEHTLYAEGPMKFEAGTPHIEGAIGLAAAIQYLRETGLERIAAYEDELMQYASRKLKEIQGLEIYGDVEKKAAVISFNVNGLHPFDVGTLLDKQGVAVRTGHHCTQPLMKHLGIQGTIRASFSFYNSLEEVDLFIAALKKAITMLV